MRWRWRRGKVRGRPSEGLVIYSLPQVRKLVPEPLLDEEPVLLNYPELEALRLVDLENLSYEDAAVRMGTSRGTVWRLVKAGRSKIVTAITEGRPLELVQGGKVEEEG